MHTCPMGTFPYIVRSGDTVWQLAQRFRTTIQEIMAANPTLDINRLYIGQIICIPQRYTPMPGQPMQQGISLAEQTLSNHLRMLWEQHVFWTRMVILSMVFGLPDQQFVTNQLLRNPKDFEDALRPLYGRDIAAKLADLLTNHLTIAAELVEAANKGDSAAAADAEKRWYANADQIAEFLAAINPYWSAQEWRQMLYDHLAMTKAEAVDIITHKYADSIELFEHIEQQALLMADKMTQGIIKQFPESFR